MDKYHHGNLKAALLKAAFHLIRKTGMEGLTLREVARRAGVSHNAPYRHFKSKEDLFAMLATEGFSQLHVALRSAIDAAEPEDRLRAASRAYLDFGLQSPSRFAIMFHAAFDRPSYPEYIAAYSESLALLSDLLVGGQTLAADLETAQELVWSSIHGITELGLAGRLREGSKPQLEALVDAAVATLEAGMTITAA